MSEGGLEPAFCLSLVEPAASLTWLAHEHGATVVIVNPDMEGQRSGPRIVQVTEAAGEFLPKLVQGA